MTASATLTHPVPHAKKSRLETLREYLLEEHSDSQWSFAPRSRMSFDVWLQEQRENAAAACHREAVEMATLARS